MTVIVVVELNTYCILILVIGVTYLNNHLGKVEGKAHISIFNTDMVCMKKCRVIKWPQSSVEKKPLFV